MPSEKRQAFEKRQTFVRRAHSDGTARLRPARPDIAVCDHSGIRSLADGRVNRMEDYVRTEDYVRYCDKPTGERPARTGQHALHAVTDVDAKPVDEPVGTRRAHVGAAPGTGSAPR
ncbi:hypothetical protein ACIP88_31675 [Streptomyces uncialis]|uniref:hypothetical protein n=1 Tax=Streptomyces uncialis TaxID=1048205 RepID=UPI0037F3E75B